MFGPRMDEGEIGRASAMKDETAAVSKTEIVRSDPWTPYGGLVGIRGRLLLGEKDYRQRLCSGRGWVGKGGVQLQRWY